MIITILKITAYYFMWLDSLVPASVVLGSLALARLFYLMKTDRYEE